MSEPLKISVHVEEKRYQPTQEKTVVPDWEPVEVKPDKGYALSKVTVEGMPEPTESETFTENGTYDVGRIGTAIVDVNIDLQNKTVTPTEQTQTVEADQGYDGLDTVTVNPIPSEYVVPTGSVDITANGNVSVAGKATANVNVPGIIPTGTKQISITANGTTTEDVSEYAEAEITVNTNPEKGFVLSEYDSDGYPHKCEFVGDWTQMPNGAFRSIVSSLFNRIDDIIVPQGVTSIESYFIYEVGIPKRIALPEGLLRIENSALQGNGLLELVLPSTLNYIGRYAIGGKFTEIVIPAGVQAILNESFRTCHKLKKVVFNGNITSIGNIAFRGCPVEIYDFSHCTIIPTLYSVESLGHASGCVIRIPAALSDTTLGEGNGWESATNWSALTDIVWEVV